MIHGSMVEAKQGLATLEDVDLKTFLCFVQWLYHGYYDAASPRSLAALEESQVPDERVQPGETGLIWDLNEFLDTTNDHYLDYPASYHGPPLAQWGVHTSQKKKNPYKQNSNSYNQYSGSYNQYSGPEQYSLKESFIQRSYTVRNIKKDAPQPRPNSDKQEEYSEVFLGHARLYVFADKYDIQILKVLAMEELHATLAVYTLYQERTSDVVALLRYVYDKTPDSEDGVEDLRTILTQYMEAEIDTLIEDEDLQEVILQDGGPLLADLMKVMRMRLA